MGLLTSLFPGLSAIKAGLMLGVGLVIVTTIGALYWQLRSAQTTAASEHDRATVEAANADAMGALANSNAAEAARERVAADHSAALLQVQTAARQAVAKSLAAALATESATNAPLAACLALPIPASLRNRP